MTRHGVVICWSQGDGCFVGETPELSGCMADGRTRQETLANLERVAGEWIKTAQELGRPIPEPRGRLTFA